MKNMLKHIPSPPSIPTPPSPPSPPKAPTPPKAPDATGAATGVPPVSLAGNTGGIDGAMPKNVEKTIRTIMEKISGKGAGGVNIKKIIADFDLDQYRDENGKLTPPFSKEELRKYMDYVKSLS